MKHIFSLCLALTWSTATQAQTLAERVVNSAGAHAYISAYGAGLSMEEAKRKEEEARRAQMVEIEANASMYEVFLTERCYDKLEEDDFEALTSEACARIFRVYGVMSRPNFLD